MNRRFTSTFDWLCPDDEAFRAEVKRAHLEWLMDEDMTWKDVHRDAFKDGRESFCGVHSKPDPSQFPQEAQAHFWAGFDQGENDWFEQMNMVQWMEGENGSAD